MTHTHTHTHATLETYMPSNDRKYFICTAGGKHNHTPTQAHTSRYSLHLRHALESVGLHRRYTLARKDQVTTLRGAGACAHERRTGVVATEGAVSKVHCPRYGHARNGAKQIHCAHLLCTDRRTPQLVVFQFKLPVSRRNRELGNQLEGILRQTNKKIRNIHLHRHTSMHVGMYDCMRSESES